MKRLTAHLRRPRLWVKREDATALGFNGNKLRDLADHGSAAGAEVSAPRTAGGGVLLLARDRRSDGR
jgi:L-cysteate sulfo-lyase